MGPRASPSVSVPTTPVYPRVSPSVSRASPSVSRASTPIHPRASPSASSVPTPSSLVLSSEESTSLVRTPSSVSSSSIISQSSVQSSLLRTATPESRELPPLPEDEWEEGSEPETVPSLPSTVPPTVVSPVSLYILYFESFHNQYRHLGTGVSNNPNAVFQYQHLHSKR